MSEATEACWEANKEAGVQIDFELRQAHMSDMEHGIGRKSGRTNLTLHTHAFKGFGPDFTESG